MAKLDRAEVWGIDPLVEGDFPGTLSTVHYPQLLVPILPLCLEQKPRGPRSTCRRNGTGWRDGGSQRQFMTVTGE